MNPAGGLGHDRFQIGPEQDLCEIDSLTNTA
jgi:hypothetical protein